MENIKEVYLVIGRKLGGTLVYPESFKIKGVFLEKSLGDELVSEMNVENGAFVLYECLPLTVFKSLSEVP